MSLFNVSIADFIPVMAANTDIGKETVTDSPLIDGKARDDATYQEEEDVQDYY